jgi:DNA polymerase/3'-5' exonuclease PolX
LYRKNKSATKWNDVVACSRDSWPATLLYFTGPESFNRALHMRAKRLGLHESNARVACRRESDGEPMGNNSPVRTERDIFELLRAPYAELVARLPLDA